MLRERSTLGACAFALLAMLSAAFAVPALAAAPARGAALHEPQASIVAIDDAQQRVELPAPAQRVVALAPNLVELAYAAGGGTRLVGVVTYSDYPPGARRVARIGDSNALDLERIAALRPDLILAWWHGNPPRQIEQLRALGIPVFQSAPATLDAIPTTLDTFGRLFGTADSAHAAAQRLRERIDALRRRYAGLPSVSVFYQVWDDPLLTLDGKQIISDAIAICGGHNVFGGLAQLVPSVSTEAVLAANPQAIVTADTPTPATSAAADALPDAGSASGSTSGSAAFPVSAPAGRRASLTRDRERHRTGHERHDQQHNQQKLNDTHELHDLHDAQTPLPLPLARWRAWPQLSAVAHGSLFALDADAISRPGPRMVDATEALCADLDLARQRLASRAPR